IRTLLAMVTDLAVVFRGQDIIRGPLADLAVLNARVCGAPPFGMLRQFDNDQVWSVTVPICFTRTPFATNEAFPAVRRGDLRLEMTVDIDVTSVDGLVLQIETVELLDINPERHLKYVRNTVEFATTGEERVPLPIGNPLLGVLLSGDTSPITTTTTSTWEQIRTKIDNVEFGYARVNWDSLVGELLRGMRKPPLRLEDHGHRYDGSEAAFATSLEAIAKTQYLEEYGYLDFDPLGDGSYMVTTQGRNDVEIQRDSGTADTGYFYPVELLSVGRSPAR
ncbi:hypothetical protein LCGC14_2786640, partial [marine sediment metagenome]